MGVTGCVLSIENLSTYRQIKSMLVITKKLAHRVGMCLAGLSQLYSLLGFAVLARRSPLTLFTIVLGPTSSSARRGRFHVG